MVDYSLFYHQEFLSEYDIPRGLIISMNDSVFLILGGDNRSLYVGEYLESQGLQVCYYAFNQTDCFENLKDAIGSAACIIMPLPFTRDRLTLNTPLFDEKVLIADICTLATPEKFFLGGQLPKSFCEELEARKIPYCDYFLLDELAIYNAVPTAEGVLQILLEELPITVHGMKCAVLGNGRVGKILSSSLKAMGASVTVYARKERDFAEIHAKSMTPKPFSDLAESFNNYDALINTVPARVIGQKELLHLNPECLIIETASSPFGIDFQATKERAMTVIKAGSLPGKVAPKTAGEIIGRSILPIIRARGLLD